MPAATAAPLIVEHVTDDHGGTLAAEDLGLRGALSPAAPEIKATLPSSGPPARVSRMTRSRPAIRGQSVTECGTNHGT